MNHSCNMKNLDTYILEKLVIDNKIKKFYVPKTKEELIENIIEVMENAPKKRDVDLNCIDVSNITDMSSVFSTVNKTCKYKVYKINVSTWDVSNVKTMKNMFTCCKYLETDISSWDTSNVEDMQGVFFGCERFNSGFDNWKVDKCKSFVGMFAGCEKLDTDLSHWDLTDVETSKMKWMFSRVHRIVNTRLPVGFKKV